MTGLRRSVLACRVRDGALDPWPPPDAEAVPDAVLLHAGGANAHLPQALDALGLWGVDCILDASFDALPAVVHPAITSVLCRDVSVERVRETEAALLALDRAGALPDGAITIELFVIAPGSFLELDDLLAASERIVSVIVDHGALPEAFGVEPSVEVDQFSYPRGRLVLAAAHRRIHAVGLFEPAGHHRRAAAGMHPARYSFAVGLHGGLCRNWAEVRACNRGFTPDEGSAARARRIIEALEEAGKQGLGAVSLDGRMIDLPFIAVSQATLRLAEQAAARTERVQKLFPIDR